MENCDNEAIVSFDTLYTNNHIQILKVLLPYFDATVQTRLAIMIKYLEFQYTMEHFKRHPGLLCAASHQPDKNGGAPRWDIVRIFSQIKNFCSPSERAMFEQLSSLKKNMEMYEEMMNMMQLFSEFSDGTADNQSQPSRETEMPNPMELLKNMLTPEQQAMFDLFQSSSCPDSSETKKE